MSEVVEWMREQAWMSENKNKKQKTKKQKIKQKNKTKKGVKHWSSTDDKIRQRA